MPSLWELQERARFRIATGLMVPGTATCFISLAIGNGSRASPTSFPTSEAAMHPVHVNRDCKARESSPPSSLQATVLKPCPSVYRGSAYLMLCPAPGDRPAARIFNDIDKRIDTATRMDLRAANMCRDSTRQICSVPVHTNCANQNGKLRIAIMAHSFAMPTPAYCSPPPFVLVRFTVSRLRTLVKAHDDSSNQTCQVSIRQAPALPFRLACSCNLEARLCY